ncbi:leucocin A/sakacin P family class II bacteriocin (plasmid) [Enterococcus sp. Edu-1]|nr:MULTISPECIES: leucocin A/sakacin P family class II bacteriocin [Enterococcus]MCA6746606.1 leucocin A/sakacin P family class II bacteriocin [Enterococcus lactis]MCH5421519.1 leucocin A/sakacin P family class II bacteriocin [Enterococcus lactis]
MNKYKSATYYGNGIYCNKQKCWGKNVLKL